MATIAGTVSLEFVPRTSTDGKAYTTVTPVVRVRPAGINAADQNKIRVMVVFGEHAREVLTGVSAALPARGGLTQGLKLSKNPCALPLLQLRSGLRCWTP